MTRATRGWRFGLFGLLGTGVAACGDPATVQEAPGDVSVAADALGDAPSGGEDAADGVVEPLTGGAGLGIDYAARSGGPVVRHEPEGTDFTSVPWPSDRDRGPSGAPDLTRFPNPEGVEMLDGFKVYGEAALDGFGLNGTAYFQLDRAIAPSSLPTPEASLAATSPIQWVALTPGAPDYGQRRPVTVRMVEDAGDPYYLGPTLAVHPVYGFPLRDGGTYCVILTREMTDESGRYLSPDTAFLADLAADPSYAPLRAWLPSSPLGLEDLASATCLTAQDATRELLAVADELERLPLVFLTQVSKASATTHHDAITAFYQSPNFQAGEKPYSQVGGDIRFDAGGRPIVQATEKLRVLILVPRGRAMPRDGWPVILYGHGTGGDWRTCVEGTEAEAVREGYVMICIDQPLHGDRGLGGEVNVLDVFNFANPASGRTSFRQSAIDVMWQARLVSEGRFDFSATPSNGNIALRLDRERIHFFGHSHGGLAGAITLGIDRRIRGAFLSGSSGVLIETILRRKDPVDIEAVVAAVAGVSVEQLDTFHPVLNLAQMLVDASDPVNYAPYWRAPRTGGPAPDVLMTSGSEDEASPSVGADAVAAAAGVPLIAPVDHPSPGHDLRGLGAEALPLSRNVATDTAAAGSEGAFTAGLRQYPGGDHFVALALRSAIELWRGFFRTAHPDGGGVAIIGAP
jgi:hypothetical protein